MRHISLYRERDHPLIGGDHVRAHVSSNAIVEPPSSGDKVRPKTLLQCRESLRKLLPLRISRIFSGHGWEVTGPNRLIKHRWQKQEQREGEIRDLILSQLLTGAFPVNMNRSYPWWYRKHWVISICWNPGGITVTETDEGCCSITRCDSARLEALWRRNGCVLCRTVGMLSCYYQIRMQGR